MDLFKKKIADIDLRNMEKKWFLNYNGGTNFDAALGFIKEEFMSKTPNGQELYTHETTATNTQNVEHVFDACKDIFLRRNLQDAGFMEWNEPTSFGEARGSVSIITYYAYVK